MYNDHYVITVSRQFASLGRTIAEHAAKKLGIYYLDRDLIEHAAKRLDISVDEVKKGEEKSTNSLIRRKFPFGLTPSPLEDEIFQVESSIMHDVAKEQSCIIVGRLGEHVLRNHPRHLHVYIYAPKEARLKNAVEVLGMDKRLAEKTLRDVDLSRAYYRRRYTMCTQSFEERELMIDSSVFSVDQAAELIVQAAKIKFEL